MKKSVGAPYPRVPDPLQPCTFHYIKTVVVRIATTVWKRAL